MVKWPNHHVISLPSDAHHMIRRCTWCSPFLPLNPTPCIHGARGFSCAPRLKRSETGHGDHGGIPQGMGNPPRVPDGFSSSSPLNTDHFATKSRSPKDGWGFPWRYPNSWMVYDGHSKKKHDGFSIPIIYQHIDDMVSRYLCIFTNLGWEYPDFAETSFLEKHTNVAGPSNGGNTTRFSQHETCNN